MYLNVHFEVHGRVSAERALRTHSYTHLVSFRDVGAEVLSGASLVNDRIELEFDDASNPVSTAFGYRPPQAEDLRLLVEWLRERRESLRAGSCLFQCEQGLSRSTAAACIALRVLGLSGVEAATEVRRKQARAVPNSLMLHLAEPYLRD